MAGRGRQINHVPGGRRLGERQVGLDVLWPQALALAGLGGALFLLGLWRFGRQIR